MRSLISKLILRNQLSERNDLTLVWATSEFVGYLVWICCGRFEFLCGILAVRYLLEMLLYLVAIFTMLYHPHYNIYHLSWTLEIINFYSLGILWCITLYYFSFCFMLLTHLCSSTTKLRRWWVKTGNPATQRYCPSYSSVQSVNSFCHA
mgnify:FL=1